MRKDDKKILSEFLYTQMVSRIEHQIKTGILVPGNKLLSVRSLSREQGVSISTAFKAYVELENMGLVEARPKSGYYVKFSHVNILKTPEIKPPLKIEQSGVAQMIALVYQNISEANILKLSHAAPPLGLIPVARLNKSMLEALRKSHDGNTGYENVQGNLPLRKQIARNAFNWDGNISENDVITTQGCIEALVFSLRAITQPGDIVAIEGPTYFGLFNVLFSLNLNVVEIPVNQDTGIDLNYLEQVIAEMPVKACLFITNF